jgi:hypothetical protein
MTADECPVSDRDPFRPAFGSPMTGWFLWFAWRPVDTVDRGWRWLCWVWRRRIQRHDWLEGGRDLWFQHAVEVDRGE